MQSARESTVPASALSTVGDAFWVTGHQDAVLTGDSEIAVPVQTY